MSDKLNQLAEDLYKITWGIFLTPFFFLGYVYQKIENAFNYGRNSV